MRIALVGYGKMGKEIEKIALERGHTISAKITGANPMTDQNMTDSDVAIDFSTPHAVLDNINFLLDQKIPSVIGTTGWNDHLSDVTKKTDSQNIGLIHASNFSIGVNLFFKLNEQLAELMSSYQDYAVSMEEIHHTEKLDAPSGTAITLAEGIIKNHPNVAQWFCAQGENSEFTDGAIQIDAIREKDVKGTHTVTYSSSIDTIRIEHEAHNRKGFALGAVVAAEWIINKKGVFTMQDLLTEKH